MHYKQDSAKSSASMLKVGVVKVNREKSNEQPLSIGITVRHSILHNVGQHLSKVCG